MPGTAHEARIAGASAPESNHCSAARSMDAATHWNGMASSANVRPSSRPSMSSRSGRFECAWVRVRTSLVARPKKEPENTPLAERVAQVVVSRSTVAGDGSAANAAPLSAPTDVPTTRSGRTPCSRRARSIPTSAAPMCPPPPSTNAIIELTTHLRTNETVSADRAGRHGHPARQVVSFVDGFVGAVRRSGW